MTDPVKPGVEELMGYAAGCVHTYRYSSHGAGFVVFACACGSSRTVPCHGSEEFVEGDERWWVATEPGEGPTFVFDSEDPNLFVSE